MNAPAIEVRVGLLATEVAEFYRRFAEGLRIHGISDEAAQRLTTAYMASVLPTLAAGTFADIFAYYATMPVSGATLDKCIGPLSSEVATFYRHFAEGLRRHGISDSIAQQLVAVFLSSALLETIAFDALFPFFVAVPVQGTATATVGQLTTAAAGYMAPRRTGSGGATLGQVTVAASGTVTGP